MNYQIESTGREAVTAQHVFDNPDIVAFHFSHEADEFNLDPWALITGADKIISTGEIVLEFGSVKEKIVSPDFVVYAQKNGGAS